MNGFTTAGFHGRKPEREGHVSPVVPLKPDGRINRFPDDLLRRVGGDFFDFHPAFGAGDKHRPSAIPIDEDAQIEFFGDARAFFDQQATDFSAFRAGLMRDQRLADQFLGQARQPPPCPS